MEEDVANLHKYVYSSEMVEFVTVANGYCQFLEELTSEEGKTFIKEAVKRFSGVYASFLKLDETNPVSDSPGDLTVSEQDWSSIYQKIAMILGAHNDFLRPADENEFDRSELVTHTISEDAADVYQELRDFTSIYSRGLEESMNDAFWELGERFAEHWGKKCLRSLTALHALYVNGVDPREEE